MAELEPVVYVIDDDASVRASIEGLLRSVGHTVVTFDSTQSFLEFSRPEVAQILIDAYRKQAAESK